MSPSFAKSSSEISVEDARYLVRWRDLPCLFEYNFEDGGKADARTAIYSSMVSDDNLQNQDKLIWSLRYQLHSDPRRALSNLGFDTRIERVNHSDFELCFLIEGTDCLTPRVLYDVGADAVCDHGIWAFEAYPQ